MKRRNKELRLHRETLRALSAVDYAGVAAGYSGDVGGCRTEIAYGCAATSQTQFKCPNNNQ